MNASVQDVVILGGACFAELRPIITAHNESGSNTQINPIAFLDDDPARQGTTIDGILVAGGLEKCHEFDNASFVFAIGSQTTRLVRHDILQRLALPRHRFINLRHPTAAVYDNENLGRGLIIHANSTIMAESNIADFAIIMPNVVVQGRCNIGEGAMLTPAVCVGHDAAVGAYSHIGSGAVIAPNVKIGPGVQVLIGSLVTKDINPGTICGGNPARAINRVKVPSALLQL